MLEEKTTYFNKKESQLEVKIVLQDGELQRKQSIINDLERQIEEKEKLFTIFTYNTMIKIKKRILGLFTIVFIFVFLYLSRNSELRGRKKLSIALKITWLLLFSELKSVSGKDYPIIPGADGFQPP